jgi:hypothetical protein
MSFGLKRNERMSMFDELKYSSFLLEKLIVAQLVRKFPAFYGTGRFITVFTRARR